MHIEVIPPNRDSNLVSRAKEWNRLFQLLVHLEQFIFQIIQFLSVCNRGTCLVCDIYRVRRLIGPPAILIAIKDTQYKLVQFFAIFCPGA